MWLVIWLSCHSSGKYQQRVEGTGEQRGQHLSSWCSAVEVSPGPRIPSIQPITMPCGHVPSWVRIHSALRSPHNTFCESFAPEPMQWTGGTMNCDRTVLCSSGCWSYGFATGRYEDEASAVFPVNSIQVLISPLKCFEYIYSNRILLLFGNFT